MANSGGRIQADLRDGMRTILGESIAEAALAQQEVVQRLQLPALSAADIARLAATLEAEIHGGAARRPAGAQTAYSTLALRVRQLLPKPLGPFPDDIAALQLHRGAASAASLIALTSAPLPDPDPREVIRRMFVRSLMFADRAYATQRELALETAQAIEVSCFNAVVRDSKRSEDPPRRQWDSDAFVGLYSGRCSTVNDLLDPESASCRAYGPQIVARLLSGALSPGALGDARAAALCPEATAAERAQIAQRIEQKVVKKTSALFRCPRCGARNSTYREVHTRGLDEAADIHCTCVECGLSFRG
jgi:predicted RNA-binding Zn-ribbon protein involved in translation (DUF1610 family)